MLEHVSWNYTSILNIVFLAITALLLWRFLRTGGPEMMKMMDHAPSHDDTAHACHHH